MLRCLIHFRTPVFLFFLLLIGSTGTVWAQNYAAPGGKPYVGDGSCSNSVDPCNLAGAVEDATDGAGSSDVFIQLPNTGATAFFEEDLVGPSRIDDDVTFDTYLPGPTVGVEGIAAVKGDIIIGTNDILTLVGNLELRLIGQSNVLELQDFAEVRGDGLLAFTGNVGEQSIQLGDPAAGCPGASPKSAFIENMRVDKGGGTVRVVDQCNFDRRESDLFISNRLDIESGLLEMDDNNLWIIGPISRFFGGVFIGAGAVIAGDGILFIAVDPAALGGPPNDAVDCYRITGSGFLNMSFDKITDAGVCIELDEIGIGRTLFNRSGALFVIEALIVSGTFRNESINGARTEFWNMRIITGNLEVEGPGSEVFPPDGVCKTGNESGVYFSDFVTVEGEVELTNTDDPATAQCIEGIDFIRFFRD